VERLATVDWEVVTKFWIALVAAIIVGILMVGATREKDTLWGCKTEFVLALWFVIGVVGFTVISGLAIHVGANPLYRIVP